MWREILEGLWVAGLDLLAPLRCPVCGFTLAQHTRCQTCRIPDPGRVCRQLRRDARGEYIVLAGGSFDGDLRALVHAFKYEQDPAARILLAGQTLLALPRGLSWDMLVPVPAHPVRVRERGWEAVSSLAQDLARACGWPAQQPLSRPHYTEPLTGRDLAERRALLRGSLRAGSVSGSLLLVDDVLTTGTTYRTCRQVLLDAGARGVDLLVAARTPFPEKPRRAGGRL